MQKEAWTLTNIWNEQLVFAKSQRKPYKRDYMWASELGKDHYSRWLKMNAIAPDFDYDERTLRKFAAGNFFERLVGFVLVAAGILIYDNKVCEIPADKDHLRISVRPDFVAGGKPDWEKAKKQISEEMLFKLMPNLGRIAESLVENFSKKYPDGLKPLVFEIKSVNSMVFWAKKDYLAEAYLSHQLQTLAELYSLGMDEGKIFYISKDDLTTAEFPILTSNKKLVEIYEKDVRAMTKYIKEGIEPPKPEYVVFDNRKKLRFQHNKKKYIITGCYVSNWEISWSNYITKITGIKGKTQKEVAEKWGNSIKPEIKAKNEAIKDKFKETLTE